MGVTSGGAEDALYTCVYYNNTKLKIENTKLVKFLLTLGLLNLKPL